MIKTIIFDLNKVLVTYNKSSDNYLAKLGVGREEFWRDREQALEEYTLGNITLDEFLSLQLKKSNLSLSKLKIAKELHESELRVVEGISALLKTLSKNFSLILMAGEGKESLAIKLDKFNLRKYFSKIYATCFSKMRKTEISFYKLILEESRLQANEVLFIDDQLQYINAAQKLGIKTIKFENVKQLISEINKIIS